MQVTAIQPTDPASHRPSQPVTLPVTMPGVKPAVLENLPRQKGGGDRGSLLAMTVHAPGRYLASNSKATTGVGRSYQRAQQYGLLAPLITPAALRRAQPTLSSTKAPPAHSLVTPPIGIPHMASLRAHPQPQGCSLVKEPGHLTRPGVHVRRGHVDVRAQYGAQRLHKVSRAGQGRAGQSR